MIYCCSVILSPILSNKKRADKIEKSRINTDFFSILSNKKLFLGSIGRMAAAAICAELIKKCVGAHRVCARVGNRCFPVQNRFDRIARCSGRPMVAPTTKRKPCTFFKSDLRGSAFSDAATAAAVGSPRFWRLIGRKNHSRVMNSNSDISTNAFSDAATAAAVGSPRFERLMVRKNHSRVINSNSDISTNAFSDAALACVHLTMTLSKAALKYLKFGERWCIMECEYCLEGREWH